MAFKFKVLTPFGVIIEPVLSGTSVFDLDIQEISQFFHKHQLVILRGFKSLNEKQDFIEYCQSWGKISLWPFGEVLELVEQERPEDHIFDNNYVPMHWDGMYRPQVPEFQIFHCAHAPMKSQGGRTTFSNTALLYNNASIERKEQWSKVTGVYERKMEFYHSKTIAPLVCEHPTKKYLVIRYCEPPNQNDNSFINHPDFYFEGIKKSEWDSFMAEMHRALYAPTNFYAHQWQTDDLIIADNHTLLHGREAFLTGAPRHLRRVHVLGESGSDNPHLEFHL